MEQPITFSPKPFVAFPLPSEEPLQGHTGQVKHPSQPASNKIFPSSVAETQKGLSPEQLSGPVVIEMFCGSARVTAALKQLGVHNSFGVDHHTKNSAK